MYHIKDDKRAYKSANLICDGLAYKLSGKSYDKISIADVCKAAGVARSTFYRLFDTLDDVLLYQFDNLFEQSIRKYDTDGNSGISYAKMILELSMGNQSLITAIVKSGRYDIFSFSTRKKEKELARNMGIQINKQDLLYCTPMLNQMVFAALGTWVEEGCKKNAQELYELLKRELKIICKYI